MPPIARTFFAALLLANVLLFLAARLRQRPLCPRRVKRNDPFDEPDLRLSFCLPLAMHRKVLRHLIF